MEELRKGGWQANIEYFEGYVIKTPKTKVEIRNKIKPHYEYMGILKQLEPTVKKLISDWHSSIKIIKSGKVPLRLFAFPEFLEDGRIKQKRVKMLSEEFKEIMSKGRVKEAKALVDKVIDFIIQLWQYGIHEITFKFYTEMGLLDKNIVLVDVGELTDDKEWVRRNLEKDEKKLEDLRIIHSYHDEVLDYYQEQVKVRLTVEVLEKNWAINLSNP
jgi:hypothetical protein